MEVNTSNLESNREQWASVDGYRNYEISWWGRLRNISTPNLERWMSQWVFNNRPEQTKTKNTFHPPASCTRVGGQSGRQKVCWPYRQRPDKQPRRKSKIRYAYRKRSKTPRKQTKRVAPSIKECVYINQRRNGWLPAFQFSAGVVLLYF